MNENEVLEVLREVVDPELGVERVHLGRLHGGHEDPAEGAAGALANILWLRCGAGSGLTGWRSAIKFCISETAGDLGAGTEAGGSPPLVGNSLGRSENQRG